MKTKVIFGVLALVFAPFAIVQSGGGRDLHRVLPGETLWSIAEKHCGGGNKWILVARANDRPDLILEHGRTLLSGTFLKIPAECSTKEQRKNALFDPTFDGARWMENASNGRIRSPEEAADELGFPLAVHEALAADYNKKRDKREPYREVEIKNGETALAVVESGELAWNVKIAWKGKKKPIFRTATARNGVIEYRLAKTQNGDWIRLQDVNVRYESIEARIVPGETISATPQELMNTLGVPIEEIDALRVTAESDESVKIQTPDGRIIEARESELDAAFSY
ncbi:LysM peptidoglycan-binding domain-containing protein [bacterium]|nr:LysM peptidoglycan-binding domain-containing protein [bacterium]